MSIHAFTCCCVTFGMQKIGIGMPEITEEQALDRLRAKKSYGVTLADLGDEFGVSKQFIGQVLAGTKPMTDPMLKAVGVARRTIFETTE